ncbi:MAG: cupin domain-containing protein [Candidatus Aenigmarchaeota archaeon]
MIPKINLDGKIEEIGGKAWNPIEVAIVNDQVVRMALCRGEYHWHEHADGDELFYVLRGELTIQMKPPYSDITLREGELAVIPKGVEHCPKSSVDTYILMFEPHALKSRGD